MKENRLSGEERPAWNRTGSSGSKKTQWLRKDAVEAEDVVAKSLGELPSAVFPTPSCRKCGPRVAIGPRLS